MTTAAPDSVPAGVDPTKVSVARVYDAFLGGKDNFEVDRQVLNMVRGKVENVHQVAQRINPEAQVVYIDNDPVVLAHGRALLEENERTHFAAADIFKPQNSVQNCFICAVGRKP